MSDLIPGPSTAATGGRSFYRVVLSDPPTTDDFTSKAHLGLVVPPGIGADAARLWDGISVFSTEAQARRAARRYPRLGAYIVRLRILDVPGIRYERTLSTPGHYTLWGDPVTLLRCVVSVRPV